MTANLTCIYCGTKFPKNESRLRHQVACSKATRGERIYYKRYRAWPRGRKGGYPDGH